MSEPAETAPTRWIDRPGVRRFIGVWLIGSYVRLVRATSRVVADPPDFWHVMQAHFPNISTSWHGQSNLAYVVMPDATRIALLISMHPDGMMMGEMARSLGYKVVEGSGASERQTHGTGGVAAFRNMLKVLKSGTMLFATADIPPEPGRNVSLGMIALARRTGRPMFAVATASSRRKVLERVWDKMQLNFPFSTIAFACEGPFYMNDETVSDEAYAAQLAAALDRVLQKAFDMADGKVKAHPPVF